MTELIPLKDQVNVAKNGKSYEATFTLTLHPMVVRLKAKSQKALVKKLRKLNLVPTVKLQVVDNQMAR